MRLQHRPPPYSPAVVVVVALSLLCLAASGCHRRTGDYAQIRLIDAIPDADQIQVSIRGEIDRKRLLFRQEIGYSPIPAGSYQANGIADAVGMAPCVLPARAFTVTAKRHYTALATGLYDGTPAPAIHLFEETPSVYPLLNSQTLVRVVNAAPDAGHIDILLNNLVAFKNLPYERMSFAAALPAGHYNCIAKTAGERFTPLNDPKPMTFQGGKSYLLVVLGRVRDGSVTIEAYQE